MSRLALWQAGCWAAVMPVVVVAQLPGWAAFLAGWGAVIVGGLLWRLTQ